MRRSVVAAILVASMAAAAGAPAAASTSPPRASLQQFVCQTALDPPARGISVKAVMRPFPGTRHLLVRFELLRARHRNGPFRALKIKVGSLGRWVGPTDPTLGQLPEDVWEPTGEVANLPAPDYYRLRVDFRWLGTGAVRLADAVRTSPTCFEPELRPYLVVRHVTIAAVQGQSGEDSYVATIANRGATAAGSFEVQLSEGPTTLATTSVQGIEARSAQNVTFAASACTAGEVITVTADPAHLLDVAGRIGSSLSVSCP